MGDSRGGVAATDPASVSPRQYVCMFATAFQGRCAKSVPRVWKHFLLPAPLQISLCRIRLKEGNASLTTDNLKFSGMKDSKVVATRANHFASTS